MEKNNLQIFAWICLIILIIFYFNFTVNFNGKNEENFNELSNGVCNKDPSKIILYMNELITPSKNPLICGFVINASIEKLDKYYELYDIRYEQCLSEFNKEKETIIEACKNNSLSIHLQR